MITIWPTVEGEAEETGRHVEAVAQGLLPSNPLTKALAYARERRCGLEAYLADPDVPIDTNYLERALRVTPMGRKNGLFSWTDPRANDVGIVQSLIVTCLPYQRLPTTTCRKRQHAAERVWVAGRAHCCGGARKLTVGVEKLSQRNQNRCQAARFSTTSVPIETLCCRQRPLTRSTTRTISSTKPRPPP